MFTNYIYLCQLGGKVENHAFMHDPVFSNYCQLINLKLVYLVVNHCCWLMKVIM